MTDTKRPPHLTRGERERAGMTTVKLSRATRALIQSMQGARLYRARTVDQVIYDLAAAALDANGPLGPENRGKIEAPFRDGYTSDRQYTSGSASIPAGRPGAGIPLLRNWPAHGVRNPEAP